jgi:hypothetical protein
MARAMGKVLAVVAVRRRIGADNVNKGAITWGEATPIPAIGARFQGAIPIFGLILAMTGVGLMVVMHGGGRGSIIRGTGTQDLELTLIMQELRHNPVSRSII